MKRLSKMNENRLKNNKGGSIMFFKRNWNKAQRQSKEKMK